jgi:hypothetical protein
MNSPRDESKRTDDFSPPSFMEGDTSNLSGFSAEDFVWIGDDGTLDANELLRQRGWHPEGALEAICAAVIAAHPATDGRSSSDRLESAIAALTGVPRKRGIGELEDYDILCSIARRYFRAWIEGEKSPEIAGIIRSVLDELPADDPRLHRADPDSRIRRLRIKFQKDRDILLARVTMEDDWNSRDTEIEIKRVLKLMNELGIRADEPSLRRTEPKGR